MARKSSSGSFFMMALVGIGGYFAYENWPAISAWFGSLTSSAGTAVAAAAGATYPNSPVPVSFSTMQTFVDSAGNQWQFSTQTGAWVIATPAPKPASPSAGTVVATAPPAAAPAPITAVPASPGTIVPLSPGPAPVTVGAPPTSMINARVRPGGPVSAQAVPPPPAITVPRQYGMPHYRSY